MYLKERYPKANKLQTAFATEVIVSLRLIKILGKQVEEKWSKTKESIPLSDEEAREIVNNDQEEKMVDWTSKIFKDVLAKLEDVRENEPLFVDKHKEYAILIDKIKTDFLTLLDERIKNIENQPSCSILNAQRSDDSETDGSSKNMDKDSSKGQEQVRENESNSSEETGDEFRCSERQKIDFKLLYLCTLILEIERTNFSKYIYW
ncbi:unnamed protein product [Mytilus edulis]|uniref:Uncharacterized protein n=1 Tax=Mytilus edulis TaxID=6550 RepID=A0A8S3Q2H3_MYTED|nr:unnamed protein product [Mytilus edulis]